MFSLSEIACKFLLLFCILTELPGLRSKLNMLLNTLGEYSLILICHQKQLLFHEMRLIVLVHKYLKWAPTDKFLYNIIADCK